jgi:hypothetical protein
MKKLFIIGTILCLGFLSAVAQELEKPRPQPDADGHIITDRKGFDLHQPYMEEAELTVSIHQELQTAENRPCK